MRTMRRIRSLLFALTLYGLLESHYKYSVSHVYTRAIKYVFYRENTEWYNCFPAYESSTSFFFLTAQSLGMFRAACIGHVRTKMRG